MAQIRWAREPWSPGLCIQFFPGTKNFGRLKCSKNPSCLPNQVVVITPDGNGQKWEVGSREPLPLESALSEQNFKTELGALCFVDFVLCANQSQNTLEPRGRAERL
jgi:hypothetical protein